MRHARILKFQLSGPTFIPYTVPELKLTRAIEICQANELSLQQLKLFDSDKEQLTKHANRDGNISRKEIPKRGNRQSNTNTKARCGKHAPIVEISIRNKSVQRLVVSVTNARNSIIMERCVAQVEN